MGHVAYRTRSRDTHHCTRSADAPLPSASHRTGPYSPGGTSATTAPRHRAGPCPARLRRTTPRPTPGTRTGTEFSSSTDDRPRRRALWPAVNRQPPAVALNVQIVLITHRLRVKIQKFFSTSDKGQMDARPDIFEWMDASLDVLKICCVPCCVECCFCAVLCAGSSAAVRGAVCGAV